MIPLWADLPHSNYYTHTIAIQRASCRARAAFREEKKRVNYKNKPTKRVQYDYAKHEHVGCVEYPPRGPTINTHTASIIHTTQYIHVIGKGCAVKSIIRARHTAVIIYYI